MKLFGNILIAVLISLPGFAFSQSDVEEKPTKTTPIEKAVEKEKDETPQTPLENESEKVESQKKIVTKPTNKKTDAAKAKPINGVKKQSAVGALLSIDDKEFVISLGSNHGLSPQDTVEFYEIQRKGFGDEEVTVLKPITLGVVLEVTKKHARVHIPMNIIVPIGSAVMKVGADFPESTMTRESPEGTEFKLTVRPFIPLETLGIGAVVDFEATHRFENNPLAVALVLSPLSFAFTDRGRPNFMTFYGQASYDAKYFEIGLGAGGAKTSQFGFSATQFLRLGTHDGLNLKVTNYLVGIKRFEFHGAKVALQVPTDPIFKNTWFVARGSFQKENQLGLGYGELGVRTLIKGRGTSGSIFLTPFLGGVGITDIQPGTEDVCNEYTNQCGVKRTFAGPSAGLTVEWRP